MNTTHPYLSVVIPAFNEEENVIPVVEDMVARMSASPVVPSFEIVLVNDGSRDKTGERIDMLASRYPEVHARHHPQNRGIGAGLRTGYAAATGEFVTSTGADGEVSVEDIISLVHLTGDADLVVSRRNRPPGSFIRELYSRVFHAFTSIMVGFDMRGMEGLYVVRRRILQDLKLHSQSSLLNVEIIMQCVARKCRVASGEIKVLPRLSGESKMATWRSIACVIWEIFKLRWALTWKR